MTSRGLVARLLQDLDGNATASSDAPNDRSRWRSVPTVRFLATVLFRLAQILGATAPPIADLVKQLNHVLTGADISWRARVGPGLVLFHPTGVVIGPYAVLGSNVHVQQGVTVGGDGGPSAGRDASPTVGDRVHLGAGCRVLGAVTVGSDSVVGANAVVTRSAAAGSTIVGVPGRVIGPD